MLAGENNPDDVLGRIIEALSGDDYEVYATKNLFMPLRMTRSFFDRAPYHLVSHRSHSYRRTDEGLREQPFDFDTGITVSNGGLNAPLGDMAKWLSFLIGGPHDMPILKRSSLDEMSTPQIRAKDGEGGSGDDVQAGLSCFIERYQGVELVGHSGDQNGFISHLYLHRPSKSGYLVSFNTDDPGEFLDLVTELRGTESSAYTESETPIFTCISASVERALDALDGEAVVARPTLA